MTTGPDVQFLRARPNRPIRFPFGPAEGAAGGVVDGQLLELKVLHQDPAVAAIEARVVVSFDTWRTIEAHHVFGVTSASEGPTFFSALVKDAPVTLVLFLGPAELTQRFSETDATVPTQTQALLRALEDPASSASRAEAWEYLKVLQDAPGGSFAGGFVNRRYEARRSHWMPGTATGTP